MSCLALSPAQSKLGHLSDQQLWEGEFRHEVIEGTFCNFGFLNLEAIFLFHLLIFIHSFILCSFNVFGFDTDFVHKGVRHLGPTQSPAEKYL